MQVMCHAYGSFTFFFKPYYIDLRCIVMFEDPEAMRRIQW